MPRVRFVLLFALATLVAATSSADPLVKRTFQTKFEKDKPFYQKVTTIVEQTVKIQGGTDIVNRHSQTFHYKWLPVTVEADKVVLKQIVEGVVFKLDLSGQAISYDSTQPTNDNPGLGDYFKGMLGSEFTVTIGKNGVVEKVEGRDQLITKLSGINKNLEEVFKKVLSDEALKEMADPSMGIIPSAEQTAGATWEKKNTLSLGPIGSYDRTFTYKYEGTDGAKGFDKITVKPSVTYKAATEADGLPFQIKGGSITTKDVKEGVVMFNPTANRVESARMNVILEGTLDVVVNGTPAKLSLYQDQRTELDTSDVSFTKKDEKKPEEKKPEEKKPEEKK